MTAHLEFPSLLAVASRFGASVPKVYGRPPSPSAPPLVADPRPESAARRAEAYCGTTRS